MPAGEARRADVLVLKHALHYLLGYIGNIFQDQIPRLPAFYLRKERNRKSDSQPDIEESSDIFLHEGDSLYCGL
ncbi:hypothetical protein ES703_63542 [subsurface metagenome]